jgi:hypothetical protein
VIRSVACGQASPSDGAGQSGTGRESSTISRSSSMAEYLNDHPGRLHRRVDRSWCISASHKLQRWAVGQGPALKGILRRPRQDPRSDPSLDSVLGDPPNEGDEACGLGPRSSIAIQRALSLGPELLPQAYSVLGVGYPKRY